MSESASALFSIADAGEFRFARFYIVCEEVPLGTPESPPIVSGVSDMHPSDFPNVEETRNPMQTFSRKKCSHFSPTNIPSAFPSEIPRYDLLIILLITKRGCTFDAQPLSLYLSACSLILLLRCVLLCQIFVRGGEHQLDTVELVYLAGTRIVINCNNIGIRIAVT